jgi:hypothetical protein
MAEPQFPDLNKASRQPDELDRVLAARPRLKAPSHTASQVLARIAALPQGSPAGPVSNPVTWAMAAPASALKYIPPEVKPLPQPLDNFAQSEEILERQQRRYFVGLVFTGAWLGLCLLLLWTVWPAASNLVFGPSSDPEMQVRLAVLQSVWAAVTDFLSDFVAAVIPLLPTLLSAAVGLALMTALIFGSNFSRRLRTE